MRIIKNLAPLSFSFLLALILCVSTAFASNSQMEYSQEIDVQTAINMVSDKVDEKTLVQLNTAESAYSLNNGEVIFEFHNTITDSSDTNDTSKPYIPIADNVNLFQPTAVDGYSLQWAKPKELTHIAAEGYGVVNGYRSDADSSLWCLELRSNVRGYGYGDFVTKFGWEVTHDNNATAITDWSPSGTTTSQTDGFTFNVSAKLTDNITLSAPFTVFAKNTKIVGGVVGKTYSVMLSRNPGIYHPNMQDLNALVSYKTGSGTTNWEWSWDIWAYQTY